MLLPKKLTLLTVLGFCLTSSAAFSGSTGTSLKWVCQYCDQIPPPNRICAKAGNDESVYCGSEAWNLDGIPQCKRFYTVTHHCTGGGTQVYTGEEWTGPGTTCSPFGTNHECY